MLVYASGAAAVILGLMLLVRRVERRTTAFDGIRGLRPLKSSFTYEAFLPRLFHARR